jgi:hypothetical protein
MWQVKAIDLQKIWRKKTGKNKGELFLKIEKNLFNS